MLSIVTEKTVVPDQELDYLFDVIVSIIEDTNEIVYRKYKNYLEDVEALRDILKSGDFFDSVEDVRFF